MPACDQASRRRVAEQALDRIAEALGVDHATLTQAAPDKSAGPSITIDDASKQVEVLAREAIDPDVASKLRRIAQLLLRKFP